MKWEQGCIIFRVRLRRVPTKHEADNHNRRKSHFFSFPTQIKTFETVPGVSL